KCVATTSPPTGGIHVRNVLCKGVVCESATHPAVPITHAVTGFGAECPTSPYRARFISTPPPSPVLPPPSPVLPPPSPVLPPPSPVRPPPSPVLPPPSPVLPPPSPVLPPPSPVLPAEKPNAPFPPPT